MAADSHERSLEEILARLPPEMRAEVRDFAASLLAQRGAGEGRRMRFDWEGALVELRDRYSSVDLQHAARDLWG